MSLAFDLPVKKLHNAVPLTQFLTSGTYYPVGDLKDGKVRFQWELTGGASDATTTINIRGRAGPDAPWSYVATLVSAPGTTPSGVVSCDMYPEMSTYCATAAASKTFSLWAMG